jgi:hypothetical protein
LQTADVRWEPTAKWDPERLREEAAKVQLERKGSISEGASTGKGSASEDVASPVKSLASRALRCFDATAEAKAVTPKVTALQRKQRKSCIAREKSGSASEDNTTRNVRFHIDGAIANAQEPAEKHKTTEFPFDPEVASMAITEAEGNAGEEPFLEVDKTAVQTQADEDMLAVAIDVSTEQLSPEELAERAFWGTPIVGETGVSPFLLFEGEDLVRAGLLPSSPLPVREEPLCVNLINLPSVPASPGMESVCDDPCDVAQVVAVRQGLAHLEVAMAARCRRAILAAWLHVVHPDVGCRTVLLASSVCAGEFQHFQEQLNAKMEEMDRVKAEAADVTQRLLQREEAVETVTVHAQQEAEQNLQVQLNAKMQEMDKVKAEAADATERLVQQEEELRCLRRNAQHETQKNLEALQNATMQEMERVKAEAADAKERILQQEEEISRLNRSAQQEAEQKLEAKLNAKMQEMDKVKSEAADATERLLQQAEDFKGLSAAQVHNLQAQLSERMQEVETVKAEAADAAQRLLQQEAQVRRLAQSFAQEANTRFQRTVLQAWSCAVHNDCQSKQVGVAEFHNLQAQFVEKMEAFNAVKAEAAHATERLLQQEKEVERLTKNAVQEAHMNVELAVVHSECSRLASENKATKQELSDLRVDMDSKQATRYSSPRPLLAYTSSFSTLGSSSPVVPLLKWPAACTPPRVFEKSSLEDSFASTCCASSPDMNSTFSRSGASSTLSSFRSPGSTASLSSARGQSTAASFAPGSGQEFQNKAAAVPVRRVVDVPVEVARKVNVGPCKVNVPVEVVQSTPRTCSDTPRVGGALDAASLQKVRLHASSVLQSKQGSRSPACPPPGFVHPLRFAVGFA